MSAPPPPTPPPPPSHGADTDQLDEPWPASGAGDPGAGSSGAGGSGAPGPRRLTRRSQSRLVGGVASGLAHYLGVDPVVVRIGFVILAFVPFPGFGVLAYLAMLLLVPEEDRDGAVVPPKLTERTAGFWIGLGLVGFAMFALLGTWNGGRFGGLLPLLLIGLGVALWVDADRRSGVGAARVSAPGGATASAWGAAPPTTPVWEPEPAGTGSAADPGARDAAPAHPDATTWVPVDEPGGPVPAAAGPDSTVPSVAPAPAGGASAVGGTSAGAPGAGAPGVDAPGAGAPAGAGYAAWETAPADGGGGSGGQPPVPPTPTGPSGPVWTPPPVRSRTSSPLGRITLGLALLAGGVAWMFDLLGVASVPLATVLAIVLLVLGVGLLVGSVLGRARWLAIVVAVVLPVTLVASVLGDLGIDLRDGIDQRRIEVASVADLGEPVAIGAGELVLDLSELRDGRDGEFSARLGAGWATVYVPEGVGLTGTVTVQVGSLEVLGNRSGGVALERRLSVPAAEGRPTIDLDLEVVAGELSIVEIFPYDAGSGDVGTDDAFEDDLAEDPAGTLDEEGPAGAVDEATAATEGDLADDAAADAAGDDDEAEGGDDPSAAGVTSAERRTDDVTLEVQP